MPPSEQLAPPDAPHWVEQDDFSGGAFPDIAPQQIPKNGVVEATNILFDKRGIARKRGGTTALVSGAQTARGTRLAAFHSSALDALNRVYVFNGSNPTAYYVNTATGALSALDTTIGGGLPSSGAQIGRPFQHFNLVVVPQINYQNSSYAGVFAVAGATNLRTEASGTAGTLIAGSNAIASITGITTNTQMEVGQFVLATNATNVYLGRITGFPDGTQVNVDPTPSVSFTATAIYGLNAWIPSVLSGTPAARGGLVGCSFQNRILFGNTHDWNAGGPGIFPRRVIFSILPNEQPTTTTNTIQGFVQLHRGGFEANNFFEIGGLDAITALVPFGDGQLLIFSKTRCFRLTGDLTTQTAATNTGLTWDVKELPVMVGCLTDESVQKTDRGVIFAAFDGVYLTDGSTFRPLMSGHVAKAWRDGMIASGVVYGSSLLQNHYIVFTNGYAWCVNLDTLAWSRITGGASPFSQVQMWSTVTDPASQAITYGLRAVTPGSSITNGQVVRVDPFFSPSSANRADADGTNVTASLTTRSMTPFDQATLASFHRVQVQYDARNGSPSVARTVVDANTGPYTTLGSLPATTARSDYTFGGGAASIQRGLAASVQVTIPATDSCEVYAIKASAKAARPGASS
jgi:hypothetical protein